jgi:hypothetical protein
MDDRPASETVILETWTGPWEADDPDANFKAEVALYAKVDPLVTLRGLSEATGIPVGALAHYVLARFATVGSAGLLELGPVMVHRLWEPLERAEAAGTAHARDEAYQALKAMVSWLRVPLVDETVYSNQPEG